MDQLYRDDDHQTSPGLWFVLSISSSGHGRTLHATVHRGINSSGIHKDP